MNIVTTTNTKGQLITLTLSATDLVEWAYQNFWTDGLGTQRQGPNRVISLSTGLQTSPSDMVSLTGCIDFGFQETGAITPPGLSIQIGASALNIVSQVGVENVSAPITAVYDLINFCVPIESQQTSQISLGIYGAVTPALQDIPNNIAILLQFASYPRHSFWNRTNAGQE